MPSAGETLDLLGVPVAGVGDDNVRELGDAGGGEFAAGRGDGSFEMSEVG